MNESTYTGNRNFKHVSTFLRRLFTSADFFKKLGSVYVYVYACASSLIKIKGQLLGVGFVYTIVRLGREAPLPSHLPSTLL